MQYGKTSGWVILALVVCVGCGGSSGTVSGKVTVKGGDPLTQGMVTFDSGAESYSAEIDGSGNLKFIGDGLPPGSYKVAVIGTEAYPEGYDPETADYTEEVEMVPVIDSKYEDSSTSGLTIEVKAGGNTIDLELDPAS